MVNGNRKNPIANMLAVHLARRVAELSVRAAEAGKHSELSRSGGQVFTIQNATTGKYARFDSIGQSDGRITSSCKESISFPTAAEACAFLCNFDGGWQVVRRDGQEVE